MLINKVRKVAPTGLLGIAKAKAIVLKWDDYAPLDKRFSRMWVWRYTSLADANAMTNGTRLIRTVEEKYRDDDELTIGQQYWYRIQAQDTFKNLSFMSAVLAITYTGTNTGDFVGTIGSAQIAAGAVLDNHIGGQLGAHKIKLVGDGNLWRNPNLTGGSGDGLTLSQVTVKTRAAAVVPGAPSRYVLEFTGDGTWNNIVWCGNPTDYFAVEPGEAFSFRFEAAADSILGTGNIYATARFENGAADGVFSYATAGIPLPALDAAGNWQPVNQIVTVPATVNGLPTATMVLYLTIPNTITAGKAYASKPRIRRATDEDMLTNGAVTEVKVDPNLPVALGTPPVLTSVAADIDQDGTPDLGFTVSWSAIPASGVNPAARLYEVEIHRSATVGGTYTLWRKFTTPDTSYVFEARRKWFHKARVRGMSFANQTGNNWSGFTATGLQPNAYSASLNASAPSVAQVANGYRITWTKPADKTYKETEVLVGGVALIRVTGNVYVDTTARAVGDTPSYAVRHFDRADNVGSTSTATVAPAYRASTSAEVGVLGSANLGAGSVSESKIDLTLPLAGAAATLVSTTADIDLDGTPDLGFTVSWSAIAASGANPKAVMYEVEVYRRAGDKGTDGNNVTGYTFWKRFPTVDPSVIFEAKRKYFHKVRYRGLAFNGQSGANWSPWTTVGIQPNAYSATLTASAPAVAQVANGYRVTWAVPADKTYSETEILVGGTPLIRLKGTAFVDTTARAIGATPTYTVRHFDRADNVGATSTGTVAPAYRATTSAELAAGAVLAANMGVGVGGNQVKNAEFRAGIDANWRYEYSSAPAKFQVALRTDTYAPEPGAYQIRQIDGTMDDVNGVNWEYGVAPARADGSFEYYAVDASKWYEFSVYYLGHRCAGIQPYIKWETGLGVHISYTSMGVFPASQGTNPNKLLAGYQRTTFFKVQPPAGAGRAMIFFRHKGTMQGIGAVDSYLWFTRVYFNECSANQTEHTPWSDGAVAQVGIDNTDKTQLAAPTGLALALHLQDVDGDGKLDTVYKATCNTVTDAVAYEFEFSRSDTSGGTYAVVETVQSPTPLGTHKVIIGKWYKVVARAISFNGTRGVPSAAVGPVQPTGVSTISGTTPAAPGVTQIANGYRVSFPVPVDKTYRETEILVGGVALTRTGSGVFVDTTARNVGDTPSYTIRHYDRSLVSSNVSSATVAPAYRQTASSEVGPQTILPSKLYRNQGNNLINDYELLEKSNWFFYEQAFSGGALTVLPPANVTQLQNPTDDGFGESDWKFRVIGITADQHLFIESDRLSPCEPGLRYEVSYWGSRINGSMMDQQFHVGVRWWKINASGTLVLVSSQTNLRHIDILTSAKARSSCVVIAPPGASFMSLCCLAFAGDEIGVINGIEFASPVIRPLPSSKHVAEVLQNQTVSTQNFGSTSKQVAKVELPFGDFDSARAIVSWGFRNASGSLKDIGIAVNYIHHVGAIEQVLFSVSSCEHRDREYVSGTCVTANPIPLTGPTVKYFELVLTGAAAGNIVNQVSLIVDLRFIEERDN